MEHSKTKVTRMAVTSEVVSAHADAVWRTAFRLLNNREDALDCYQQTFLDAMRLNDCEVRNWRAALCCIATRRAMDQLRRRYRDQQVRTRTDIELPNDASPDQRALDEELRQQVRQALTKLPPQQAEAFWLRHIEQMSPSEVAVQMDIQPGNVRVLVHRAAEQLRQMLGGSYALRTDEGESK
jgi:RNA polymerase sigma-70 factor (ECF subfamily)